MRENFNEDETPVLKIRFIDADSNFVAEKIVDLSSATLQEVKESIHVFNIINKSILLEKDPNDPVSYTEEELALIEQPVISEVIGVFEWPYDNSGTFITAAMIENITPYLRSKDGNLSPLVL